MRSTDLVPGVAVLRGYRREWLRGDVLRIRQALLNFASNAVRFTERGSITLRAELLDATLRLLADAPHPDDVSIRAIAREAGVSPTAAYRHFEDRDELVRIRDYMVARGPDGAGAWHSDDGRVGLAHRGLLSQIGI